MNVTRPKNLASFKNPPLNEVVIGIQFSTPEGYNQIYAKEVWDLFKHDYPTVEDKAALALTFETFPQSGHNQIEFKSGASHDRFWFISETKNDLIQFQENKFLHNWRKGSQINSDYPRYEIIKEKFINEIICLEAYFKNTFSSNLKINQCELSYINHIQYNKNIFNFINLTDIHTSDFYFTFKEELSKENKKYGRFICDAGLSLDQNQNEIIVLNLTIRGKPENDSIESTIEFIDNSRILIVEKFDQLTSTDAHKVWEKVS